MEVYILLLIAICCGVFSSTMLNIFSKKKKVVTLIGVIVGYFLSFYLLSLTLKELQLGFVYAIWSGIGTILTATIGIVIFKEGISRKKVSAILCIVVGVVILNFG